MITTCVYVEVKPEFINEFIKESEANHNEAIKEPGNLRFDILQLAENPCMFMLYEAYISEEAAATHKTTAHYFKWRENVEKMMAKPRNGLKYNILLPKSL